MNAQLIESDDEHHWVLIGHRVTQLQVELRAVRLQTWSLDGSVEVRIAAPFVVRRGAADRQLVPDRAESLAPLLGCVGLGVRSLTVTRDGTLGVQLADDRTIECARDPRAVAWEVQGGGLLEGLAYRPAEGPGAPWE